MMAKTITKRVGRYSDEIRSQAAIQYAIKGCMTLVSEDMSIPRTTINDWKKEDWWDDIIVRVRQEKQQLHIAKYNNMVDLAQDKAIELIPTITSAREATLVACMSQDKGQLLQGLPTSISAKSEGMEALAKEFQALSEKMTADDIKVIKVVSEQ